MSNSNAVGRFSSTPHGFQRDEEGEEGFESVAVAVAVLVLVSVFGEEGGDWSVVVLVVVVVVIICVDYVLPCCVVAVSPTQPKTSTSDTGFSRTLEKGDTQKATN
jgi:hypothetical protein